METIVLVAFSWWCLGAWPGGMKKSGSNSELNKILAALLAVFLPLLSPVGASEPGGCVLLDTDSSGKRVISSSKLLSSNRRKKLGPQQVKYKQGIPCVPMMLIDDPNTLIVCDRDANLKAEKRTITLSRGKGVYMVGKLPLIIETPLGTVNLPGNSAAIIEQADNGLLRVDHLTGQASNVSVKRWKGTRTYTASSGDEICLAPRGSSPKELLPRDGVPRQDLSTEVGDNGILLTESKFEPKTMLDKECLLQCDSNSFIQVRRKVYLLRRSIDEQENETGAVGHCKNDNMPLILQDSKESLKAVSHAEPFSQALNIYTKETGAALVKYDNKTEIEFNHPLVTELKSGEAVFLAEKNCFIKTPGSMIKLDPAALVLVSVNDDVVKLRTLWENHRNSVHQIVSGTNINVLAGDESILSPELRSVYLAASKDMVGRRLTHFTELPSGGVVHFSEVSLISLAQSSDLLNQLASSSESQDRSIVKRINKMAAILVQISASHGMYELMQAPQWKRELRSSSSAPVL